MRVTKSSKLVADNVLFEKSSVTRGFCSHLNRFESLTMVKTVIEPRRASPSHRSFLLSLGPGTPGGGFTALTAHGTLRRPDRRQEYLVMLDKCVEDLAVAIDYAPDSAGARLVHQLR
jgi:hypothetical protein